MKTVLHKAATRGHANYGWLDTWHSFSFGNYHDPHRLHFGALRVLNDDTLAPGAGIGRHAHENREIITILLSGSLAHEDNKGNRALLQAGDVEVMSAGLGIEHAEKNASSELPASFLQLWIYPDTEGLPPRYEQQRFPLNDKQNKLLTIVSPLGTTGGGIGINQQAWLSLGVLEKNNTYTCPLHKAGNGIYVFLLSGDITVNEIVLNARDGLGVWETDQLSITANTEAELLVIEVPVAQTGQTEDNR
ncbi:pirin family protein [Flavisolibacter sp. BT320]|nr:pirin family protein [Flavisolibacter longurius]